MSRFWRAGKEVERQIRVLDVGDRRRLVGVHKIRELDRVSDEEDRLVDADQIPIALIGIEFDGEPTRIARGLGRTPVAHHGRETNEDRRLLARLSEQRRLRVAREIL